MKKHALGLVLCAFSILITACSSTKQVVLQTTEPSPVMLADQIKRIGVIKNSECSTGMEGNTKDVDQLVMAQEKWLAEKGKEAAIEGLFDELLKDKRFETVKLLDSAQIDVPDFDVDNTSALWTSIAELCTKHDVDAVFAMAFYETDTKVSVSKTSMLQPNLMRVKVKVPAQELTLETLIENGWRIYYPKDRRIIDEIVFNDQLLSTGKGVNALAAYQSIGNRKEILIQQSRSSGSNYGQRLLPFEKSVTREYYVKGSDNLVLAGELIMQGDWEGAGRLWEMDVESKDLKIRRRSCHNLAVFNERKNDLEAAFQWASQAYDSNHDEEALDYMNILMKRIEDQDLLRDQMAQLQFEY